MPGAYAHITLVNEMRATSHLESLPGFSDEAITSVLDYFKFCELGVVSPDYPYLTIGDSGATSWADLMHYTHTGQMIQAGIKFVKLLDGPEKHKAFAWLLGYSAHVATDVTIHPVVELIVGPYAQNKTAHRICEMHQDAYIFQRLDVGEVGLSEHLDSGISACSQPGSTQMDHTISSLWSAMLNTVHPIQFKLNKPNIDKWHQRFKLMVDEIGEEGNRLMPIARHVAVNCGLTYPAVSEIDAQYIKSLKVPTGHMDYDQIFEKAILNVGAIWSLVAKGVFAGDEEYLSKFGEWNLDTGRDENGQLVFWRTA